MTSATTSSAINHDSSTTRALPDKFPDMAPHGRHRAKEVSEERPRRRMIRTAVVVAVGMLAGRVARLDVPASRAVVFSGATRNSLVVLPLVLALSAAFDLAPLVVATQTLIGLVAMVIFVRLVPRLVSVPTPAFRARRR